MRLVKLYDGTLEFVFELRRQLFFLANLGKDIRMLSIKKRKHLFLIFRHALDGDFRKISVNSGIDRQRLALKSHWRPIALSQNRSEALAEVNLLLGALIEIRSKLHERLKLAELRQLELYFAA